MCFSSLTELSIYTFQNVQFYAKHLRNKISMFCTVFEAGCVVQSVAYLATDVCLIADPGVASLILAWYYTLMEIDHEILISTVILLPSHDSFKKGCCQLQAKVCAQITG